MSLVCHIHAGEDLRFSQVDPTDPGPNEVEVRLGAAGICGSDLHYYFHGKVGAFVIREPLTPGHEAAGIVTRVGSAVTRVVPGNKVAINPSHACGACDYCRAGRDNLCRNMRFLGSASVYPHVQGMFREHFLMHERQLTPVDTDISLGELAFAEPLSVALHGVRRAGELMGRTVLVTGGGTIGSLAVMAARLAGAAHVIVCDIADRPLEVALRAGAHQAIRTDRVAPQAVADLADICLEAAGSAAALETCLQAARRGGRIVQIGTLPAQGLHFPANSIMARELEYVGAFRFAGEFDWAVRYLAQRRLDVRPLLSAQLPLAQAAEAFRLAADKTRSTKVQLTAA